MEAPVDHTAAYLTLAGTLGGVLATSLFAYFTGKRRDAAEKERHDDQLAHERGLSDLADLRSTITATIEAYEGIVVNAERTLNAKLEGEPFDERAHSSTSREAATTSRAGK